MVKKSEEVLKELNEIYDEMPDTVGCVSCGKCCRVQHPHCYFSEFLNMYSYIIDSWDQKGISDLVSSCVERYLSNELNKPCVFLGANNMCKIYEKRDYNCRAFGIIPKKAYAKHVQEVKKNFPGMRLDLEKQSDCCGGVKPEKYIGAKKLDNLFGRIYELDRDLGVSQDDITAQNNYMTFHDHFLLFVYGAYPDFLNQLTAVKRSGSESDKKQIIDEIKKEMEKENGAKNA